MAVLRIHTSEKRGIIHKEIYGHFAEHLGRGVYEGVFVDEKSPIENIHGIRLDVLEALKEIKVPVIRWPGGCFADEYHWKDGIGPKNQRKKIINTNWGGVIEDNSFGTHEFFELCELLGCEAYVNGNLGSGTVKEMQEWMEYITFDGDSPLSRMRCENGHKDPWRMKYFGVGNESWGCGGNMRPEYYADEYRKYQSFLHDSQEKKAYKIAVGPSMEDTEWTGRMLEACYDFAPKSVHGFMDGLSVHYYMYVNGFEDKRSATQFDENEWYQTMKKAYIMEEILCKNEAIMDTFDPDKNIALIVDEWGNWFDCEEGTNPGFLYQQNTIRDAVTAGMNLNIFNEHCQRVAMTNIAQMVNVLQAIILTEGDKMVKTPTYHAFDLFKVHQDAQLLYSTLETEEIGKDENKVPNLTKSVSENNRGMIHITLTNQSWDMSYPIRVKLEDRILPKKVTGKIINGEVHDYNTFNETEKVVVKEFNNFQISLEGVDFVIPPSSVMQINLSI